MKVWSDACPNGLTEPCKETEHFKPSGEQYLGTREIHLSSHSLLQQGQTPQYTLY